MLRSSLTRDRPRGWPTDEAAPCFQPPSICLGLRLAVMARLAGAGEVAVVIRSTVCPCLDMVHDHRPCLPAQVADRITPKDPAVCRRPCFRQGCVISEGRSFVRLTEATAWDEFSTARLTARQRRSICHDGADLAASRRCHGVCGTPASQLELPLSSLLIRGLTTGPAVSSSAALSFALSNLLAEMRQ